jgi:predicted glycosyltransferase
MPPRKRIMIFLHDGRGLGHLRRLSRIAAKLQEQASVLFVAGHREVAHMVPRECEFVHIPSLDSIDKRRTRHWARAPFLGDDMARGRALRSELLRTTFQAFAPDAFVSDYLPLGIDQELVPLLTGEQPCRKYFIIRGLLGAPDYVRSHVLTPQAKAILERHYDLLLATCDARTVDVAGEYGLSPTLRERLEYTGYVVEPFSPERCQAVRADRLLPEGAKWVVCTAGGGKDGEDLLERCWELALQFPECYFDLITGPRSRLSVVQEGWYAGTRIRVQQSDSQTMPYRLGGADVVITRGGYNSLMESCVGNARIIVVPIQSDYEQVHHPARLAPFRPLEVVHELGALDLALEAAMHGPPVEHSFHEVDTDGAAHTARAILHDVSRVHAAAEQSQPQAQLQEN